MQAAMSKWTEWVTYINMASKEVGFLDIANKNTGQPVKFEFQINKLNFWYKYAPGNIWDILILKR